MNTIDWSLINNLFMRIHKIGTNFHKVNKNFKEEYPCAFKLIKNSITGYLAIGMTRIYEKYMFNDDTEPIKKSQEMVASLIKKKFKMSYNIDDLLLYIESFKLVIKKYINDEEDVSYVLSCFFVISMHKKKLLAISQEAYSQPLLLSQS